MAKPSRGAGQLFAEGLFAVSPRSFLAHPQQQPHSSHLVLRGRCPQDLREGISWLGLDHVHQHLLGARDQRDTSGVCSKTITLLLHQSSMPFSCLPTGIPTPASSPEACRAHPHLSNKLLVSFSSLLATGTSLPVRVREISILLSWESICSALPSAGLATFSPVRAERARVATRGSEGLASPCPKQSS